MTETNPPLSPPTKEEEQDSLALARMGAQLMMDIEAARKSPLGLYKLCFSDDLGNEVIIKPFHEVWNYNLTHFRKNLIEAARGVSKTSFLLAYTLWRLGRNPNTRIKWISSDDDEAAKRLKALRDHIVSPLYQAVFPNIQIDKKKTNNNTQLHVVRTTKTPEPTIEAIGILSSGTGGRADEIVFDDCCSYRNSVLNPQMRSQVVDKIRGDWLPTLEPRRGRIVSIFTPWSDEDGNAYLKRTSRWQYSLFCHGKDGDPYFSIFPELFPRETLMALRLEEGDINYARSRLCKAVTKDTVIVPPEALVPYTGSLLTVEKLARAIAILSADPASGKDLHKGKLDYFSPSVLLLVPDYDTGAFEIFIVVCYSTRISSGMQVALMEQLYHAWQPLYVVVEDQGMQALAGALAEQSTIPGECIIPMPATISKGQRLVSITNLLVRPEGERSVVYFHPSVIDPQPEPFVVELPSGEVAEAFHALRHQILSFPTKHDDEMDSVVQGLRYIQQFILPQLAAGVVGPGSSDLRINDLPAPLPVVESEQDKRRARHHRRDEPDEEEIAQTYEDIPAWARRG